MLEQPVLNHRTKLCMTYDHDLMSTKRRRVFMFDFTIFGTGRRHYSRVAFDLSRSYI